MKRPCSCKTQSLVAPKFSYVLPCSSDAGGDLPQVKAQIED